MRNRIAMCRRYRRSRLTEHGSALTICERGEESPALRSVGFKSRPVVAVVLHSVQCKDPPSWDERLLNGLCAGWDNQG